MTNADLGPVSREKGASMVDPVDCVVEFVRFVDASQSFRALQTQHVCDQRWDRLVLQHLSILIVDLLSARNLITRTKERKDRLT